MNKRLYCSVNLFVLGVAAMFFFLFFADGTLSAVTLSASDLGCLAATALLVHVLKSARLYFEMYEKQMPVGLFLRQYCKVVLISMILPYKIGDLFRAWCYGYHLHDYLTGFAVIIFDRFVDTAALASVMMLAHLFLAVKLQALFYIFVLALFALLVFFIACDGICAYWKHFFIKAESSGSGLALLSFLQGVQNTCRELRQVIAGKFLLVYLLSMLAWCVEIGGLFVVTAQSSRTDALTAYLSEALTGVHSLYFKGFVVAGVVLLSCFYLLILFFGRARRSSKSE